MITFTLIIFILSPGNYFRIEREDRFVTVEECRAAGTEAVKVLGGFDKARFHCKEVRDDRK